MKAPLIRKLFFTLPRRRWFFVLVSTFPLLIVIAAWIDGTLKMVAPNKGLIQHYGFWTIFVTTPLISTLSWRLCKTFITRIRKLDQDCSTVSNELKEHLKAISRRHVQSLSLRKQSAWILLFILLILSFWWLFNVLKTISPETTYHHDVFDGYTHHFGFYITKIYILLIFGWVYAIAIFFALHVTASLISILKFVFRHNILRIDLFHPDNCGGTSKFGNINLLILAIYASFFAIDFGMYLTHQRTYLAIIASLIASSVLAILQSIAAVYYLHMAVAKKKDEFMNLMSTRLNQQFTSSLTNGGPFPNDLLTIRNHVAGVHTFPYATGALKAVNVIRFAPAALAVVTYFTQK